MLANLMANCRQAEAEQALHELHTDIAMHRAALLNAPETPAEILTALAASADDANALEHAAFALQRLLDEARMDAEKGGQMGRDFLATFEAALAHWTDELSAGPEITLIVVQAYYRAQLEVPPCLSALQAAQLEERFGQQTAPPPDIAQLVGGMLEEAQGEVFILHDLIREGTAAMPAEARAAVVHACITLQDDCAGHLAAYWLLDPDANQRQIAAAAVLELARAGRIDGDLVRRLALLRSWMPGDAARAVLDEAGREIRRRQFQPTPARTALKPDRVLATLPDGTGAQSFAVFSGGRAGMVMTKPGYGVRDAYVVACASREEVANLETSFAEMDPFPVSPDALRPFLAAALADGHAHDRPPAHALIDIVELAGLEDIRPQALTASDWLEMVDPKGQIAAMSPQKRGRLINRSANWTDDYPLMASWFEDNAEVRDIVAASPLRTRQRSALWAYLEDRRRVWAERMLISASLLAQAGEDSLSMAATGWALLEGRPLRKVPVMERIVETTQAAIAHGQSAEKEEYTAMDLPIAWEFMQPASNDLATLMAGIGLTETAPAWLDGYIAATLAAPVPVEPQDALNDLFANAPEPVDGPIMEGFLNAFMQCYQDILVSALEGRGAAPAVPGTGEAAAPDAWARGFARGVDAHSQAWKQSRLHPDDKQMLTLMRELASGKPGAGHANLIGQWLAARYRRSLA